MGDTPRYLVRRPAGTTLPTMSPLVRETRRKEKRRDSSSWLAPSRYPISTCSILRVHIFVYVPDTGSPPRSVPLLPLLIPLHLQPHHGRGRLRPCQTR